jgi:uncharacterized membrane protein YfcA
VSWELTLTGALIGLLVGATGMGGGSLMTPILIWAFGFNPVVAVGTDVLHGALFKTIGAWRHRVLGHVHAFPSARSAPRSRSCCSRAA